MALEIWIPEGARQKVYSCTCCGTRFPERQFAQFVRHANACSERHEDEIEEELHEIQSDPFKSPMDLERTRHFQRGGN